MSHILLFEPKKDQVRRLIFLLRLSGHNCTIAYTLEETLNWLKTKQLLENGFDLLLIGSNAESVAQVALLNEVQSKKPIPVICLQDKPAGIQVQELPDRVEYCQPEELMSKLNDCLPIISVYGSPSISEGEGADLQ